MTKSEFIRTASNAGYCNKKEAEEYCKQNDFETYTADDFIKVYDFAESQKYKSPGRPIVGGGYSSKRYFADGGSEGNR